MRSVSHPCLFVKWSLYNGVTCHEGSVKGTIGGSHSLKLICTADVDGTLITATGPDANKLHKLAFAHAMKKVFDVETNIGTVSTGQKAHFAIVITLR